MNSNQSFYDRISRLLTDYEHNTHNLTPNEFLQEFYDLLVDIQNNWGDIIDGGS